MVEERRWPLGNKVTELHVGEETGFISSIKWKDTLIAWCYSKSQVLQVKLVFGLLMWLLKCILHFKKNQTAWMSVCVYYYWWRLLDSGWNIFHLKIFVSGLLLQLLKRKICQYLATQDSIPLLVDWCIWPNLVSFHFYAIPIWHIIKLVSCHFLQ